MDRYIHIYIYIHSVTTQLLFIISCEYCLVCQDLVKMLIRNLIPDIPFYPCLSEFHVLI